MIQNILAKCDSHTKGQKLLSVVFRPTVLRFFVVAVSLARANALFAVSLARANARTDLRCLLSPQRYPCRADLKRLHQRCDQATFTNIQFHAMN